MSLFAIKAIAVADREITVEWGVKRVGCTAADMWQDNAAEDAKY